MPIANRLMSGTQTRLIFQVALQAGAQAIHPGYGFLAENPGFAQQCVQAGLVFIGPKPDTIKLLGDKLAVRKLVRRLNLNVLGVSDWNMNDQELLIAADRIGFPLLIKTMANGSRQMMHPIYSRSELEIAIPLARQEACALVTALCTSNAR